MARQSRASLPDNDAAVIEAMKAVASGKNPDGTDYTLPVEQGHLGPNDHPDSGSVGGFPHLRGVQLASAQVFTGATPGASAPVLNANNRGIYLFVEVLSYTGTPGAGIGIQFTLQTPGNAAATFWKDITPKTPGISSTAAQGINAGEVFWYPGISSTAAAPQYAAFPVSLPDTWRVVWNLTATGDSVTFNLYARMVL